MKSIKKMNQSGFTLIEILMAVLVIAILAVVGITQFVNFGKDAKDSATKDNLSVLRAGIAAQNGLERIRCNKTSTDFPLLANITANDITNTAAAGPCIFSSLINPTTGVAFVDKPTLNTTFITLADAKFVATGIPVNSWGLTTLVKTPINTVQANVETVGGICDGKGVGPTGATGLICTAATAFVGNAALVITESGWCYCKRTGEIWANSAANNGLGTGTGNEFTF